MLGTVPLGRCGPLVANAPRHFGMILKLRSDVLKLQIDVSKLRIEDSKLRIDDLKLRIDDLKLPIADLKIRVEILNLRIRVSQLRIGHLKLPSGVLRLQIDDLGLRSVDVSHYTIATYAQVAGMGAGRQRFLRPFAAIGTIVQVPFRQTVAWPIHRFTGTPTSPRSCGASNGRRLRRDD